LIRDHGNRLATQKSESKGRKPIFTQINTAKASKACFSSMIMIGLIRFFDKLQGCLDFRFDELLVPPKCKVSSQDQVRALNRRDLLSSLCRAPRNLWDRSRKHY
jgi:hypothetical protein